MARRIEFRLQRGHRNLHGGRREPVPPEQRERHGEPEAPRIVLSTASSRTSRASPRASARRTQFALPRRAARGPPGWPGWSLCHATTSTSATSAMSRPAIATALASAMPRADHARARSRRPRLVRGKCGARGTRRRAGAPESRRASAGRRNRTAGREAAERRSAARGWRPQSCEGRQRAPGGPSRRHDTGVH